MQIFGRSANLVLKVAGCTLLAVAGIGAVLIWALPRSDYRTLVRFVRPQPVPFSHRHHVAGLGLDCRYCHSTVEISATAGMPPTETCMTCHSQIWTNAPVLAPVRQSLADDQPLHWRRVYDLPDYVYFDHSIHIAKGVGCASCHGAIDDMALTARAQPLTMGWCLDCHRDPAPNLRPREGIFDLHWTRGPGTPSGAALMAANDVHAGTRLIECSICHR